MFLNFGKKWFEELFIGNNLQSVLLTLTKIKRSTQTAVYIINLGGVFNASPLKIYVFCLLLFHLDVLPSLSKMTYVQFDTSFHIHLLNKHVDIVILPLYTATSNL